MPDWMKCNGVKKTAVAAGRRCDEQVRRMMGIDEHSPQWRGECCRGCPWWSGSMCLDEVNEYVHCRGYGVAFREYRIDAEGRCRECAAGRVAPQRTENGEQSVQRRSRKPSTATERPCGATEGPAGKPSGGVHLFDW